MLQTFHLNFFFNLVKKKVSYPLPKFLRQVIQNGSDEDRGQMVTEVMKLENFHSFEK